MNKTIKICCMLFFVVFACNLADLFANTTSPREQMNQTLDKLVETVEALPGDANKIERRKKMREIIEPRFDFSEMAKRSLGTNWSSLDQQQRADFVAVFSELLAKTYLDKVDMIERGMVKITQDRIHQDKSMIKTEVSYKGDRFGLDYRLLLKDDGWRVYDVVIENIGLVANYRNEFAGVIRKEKFSGLMQKLRDKVGS